MFLAGAFAFLMLRRLGLAQLPALFGATIFELGGYFASQTQHLGAINAAAWIPLAWLAAVELGRSFSWRRTAMLAASLSMTLLAGFPAVTFVAGVSTVLVGVAVSSWKSIIPCCLAGAWSLLLSAAQVLPTAELSRLSVAKYRGDWLGTGGGIPLQSLVSLVSPNHYGIFDLKAYSHPWQVTFLYVYCGLAALAFAIAALFVRRDRLVIVFGTLTGLTGVWMLGDSTVVGRFVNQCLPGAARTFVYPEFAMAAFILSFATLAALGADRFAAFRKPVAGALLVAVAAIDLIATGSGRPINTAVLANEPGVTDTSFDGNADILPRLRALVRQTRPPARIDTIDDSMDWAMSASITRIPTANGNDPFALIRLMQVRLSFTGGERWGRYYQVKQPASPVLGLVNVRYLITRARIEATADNLISVAELPGRTIYLNRNALPRFFLVNDTRRATGMEEALAMLRSPEFSPRETAIVEGDADAQKGSAVQPGSVRVVEYRPLRVVLDTESSARSFLVTSETNYPGWRAFVDSEERTIVQTNVAFRGLTVPAGKHRIEMRFQPRILYVGVALSALGWLLLIVAVTFGDNRRMRAAWNGPTP